MNSMVFFINLPGYGACESKFSEEEPTVYFSICGLEW